MYKIRCPRHDDKTASCAIYPDGTFHCFGCGAHGQSSELGEAYEGEVGPDRPKFVEDVARTVPAIESLPLVTIRGLELHANDHGYYIVWPCRNYYKHRSYTPVSDGAKYKGPAGVAKPLFQVWVGGNDELIVIEGELNALSLARARPDLDIVSPGGAGDFYSKRTLSTDTPLYRRYKRIICIVDEDAAGAAAAIRFKSHMVQYGLAVTIKMMKKDANDLLVERGLDGLKEETQRMGL